MLNRLLKHITMMGACIIRRIRLPAAPFFFALQSETINQVPDIRIILNV